MARRLSKREKQHYRAGGFRLEGRRYSQAAAERALLHAAARILRIWGAGPRATRATLALPSSKALLRWRCGRAAIRSETQERVAVTIAIYARLVETNDHLDLKPLPPLKRAGRKSLSGQEVLAAGRLSDLLALWRQLVLAEEAAARRRVRR